MDTTINPTQYYSNIYKFCFSNFLDEHSIGYYRSRVNDVIKIKNTVRIFLYRYYNLTLIDIGKVEGMFLRQSSTHHTTISNAINKPYYNEKLFYILTQEFTMGMDINLKSEIDKLNSKEELIGLFEYVKQKLYLMI